MVYFTLKLVQANDLLKPFEDQYGLHTRFTKPPLDIPLHITILKLLIGVRDKYHRQKAQVAFHMLMIDVGIKIGLEVHDFVSRKEDDGEMEEREV